MSTLTLLSRPARWLLVCFLVFGLVGLGITIVARTPRGTQAPGPAMIQSSSQVQADAPPPRKLDGLASAQVGAPTSGDSWIAFAAATQDGRPGVYVMSPDGSGLHPVAGAEAGRGHWSWSKDGHAIVFCAWAGLRRVPSSHCVEELGLKSNGLPLGKGAAYFDTRPVPSPVARVVAFRRVHTGAPPTASILSRDIAIRRMSTIVSPSANAGLGLDWAPDGSAVAYSAAPGWGVENLWTASADGRVRRQLTNLPAEQGASFPTFSPDGEWIAFRLLGDGQPKLMRIRPDGTGLSLIASLDGLRAPTALDWGPAFVPYPPSSLRPWPRMDHLR